MLVLHVEKEHLFILDAINQDYIYIYIYSILLLFILFFFKDTIQISVLN